jgi:endonuclease/exonuclease/phosphatase family metal-dependent hydrolase
VGTFALQTWNCFGTAMNAKAVLRRRGPPDARRLSHPQLWRELHQVDALCIQEVWLQDVVELFDRLEFDHKLRDDSHWEWRPLTVGGSGLGLASRNPLVRHEVHNYRTAGVGTDGWVRKGFLLARLRVSESPLRELDLVTTHLQSNQGPRMREVRARQLAELRRAVEEFGSAERPFLVCGDLNIDGLGPSREQEYASLRQVLSEFEDLGAGPDQPTLCPEPQLNALAHRYWSDEPVQRLDYVLFRPARDGWARVSSIERVLDEPLPGNGDGIPVWASDHFGLRVRFELTNGAA